MENFKNQFEIELELDPFKNYVNVTIEAMEENWRLVAQKVIGETDETRQIGIQTLKVQHIKKSNDLFTRPKCYVLSTYLHTF